MRRIEESRSWQKYLLLLVAGMSKWNCEVAKTRCCEVGSQPYLAAVCRFLKALTKFLATSRFKNARMTKKAARGFHVPQRWRMYIAGLLE